MPEEQTSLQEAMARIMGAPAGGAPQPPPMADEVAPKTPYSEDLANFVPATDVTLSNEGAFDPFAKQNAELEAMRAQTTAMQASLQQQLAAQAARPAYTPPPLPALWTPPASSSRSAPAPPPIAPPHVTQAWERNVIGGVVQPTPSAVYGQPAPTVQINPYTGQPQQQRAPGARY